MTGVKISTLPVADAANDTDQLEVNQGGTSRRITLGQVSTLVTDALPSSMPPQRTAAITYYVSTTGNDANSGASAAAPVLTFQKALDLCAATALYSAGPFTIQTAPGTYTVAAELTFVGSLFITSPVTFSGTTSSGVPTTIIQGSADGTRTHSFITPGGSGLVFLFQYIRFQSFDYAVIGSAGARIVMTRCNAKNCNRVMVISLGANGSAQEGDWDGRDLSNVTIPTGIGCSSAIGGIWNLSQDDPATNAFALKIHHWFQGFVSTEGVSGHMDYLQFEDCTDASLVLMRGSCAPNMSGIIFRRCPVGIRTIGPMAGLLISDTATFDTVTTPIQRSDGPTVNTMSSGGYDSRLSYCIRNRTENTALGGTLTESNFFIVEDIVPGRMRAHDRLAIRMYGPCVGLIAVLTFRLKFGGTTIGTFTVPIGASRYELDIQLAAQNNTSVVGRGRVTSDNGATTTTGPSVPITGTGAVSTTVLTSIVVTAQLGNVGDAINMNFGTFDSTIAGLSFP